MPGRAARAVRRLARAHADAGLRGFAVETLLLARTAAVLLAHTTAELVFDWRRGVNTRGLVRHEAALVALSAGGDPVYYEPIDRPTWRRVHATIPIDRGTATFVDLGAGRGRAVILAAELGFGRIVGVELDARLTEEARENVRRWQSRRRSTAGAGQDVVIVRDDAATYRMPDGPLVVWLFNPFGATTLRQVLRRLCEEERPPGEPVFVAYVHSVHADVVNEFPQLRLHSRGTLWGVYRVAPSTSWR